VLKSVNGHRLYRQEDVRLGAEDQAGCGKTKDPDCRRGSILRGTRE